MNDHAKYEPTTKRPDKNKRLMVTIVTLHLSVLKELSHFVCSLVRFPPNILTSSLTIHIIKMLCMFVKLKIINNTTSHEHGDKLRMG